MRAHGPRPLRCRLRVTATPRDLDLAAPDVLTAFELAAGGLEGIAQGHMGVFMSVIERMAVADYDLLVRYVMSIGMSCSVSAAGAKLDWCRGAFGADPAAQNVGTEPPQMRRELADARAAPLGDPSAGGSLARERSSSRSRRAAHQRHGPAPGRARAPAAMICSASQAASGCRGGSQIAARVLPMSFSVTSLRG